MAILPMILLRGRVSFLEIVFVGQCDVFVCLDFIEIFFPLAVKLIVPRTGCHSFKKMSIFFDILPLNSLVHRRNKRTDAP